MAFLYEARGIVLSRRDRKEADRCYFVFTKEHGKIEFIARGGHKILAKLTPHLESVAEVDLLIVNGRAYDTVAGVERHRAFPNIYQDWSRLLLARNALFLVDIGTRTHQHDPILYDELVHFLDFINESPSLSVERSSFVLGTFAVKLLSLIGYHPELYRCLVCKKNIVSGQYRWHALKGGVVCQECAKRNQEDWFAARPLQDETLKLLRFALTEPFSEQLRPELPGQVLSEFHDTVESLIISHFPTIPPNSLRGACLV